MGKIQVQATIAFGLCAAVQGLACGDDGSRGDSDTATNTPTLTNPTATTTPTTSGDDPATSTSGASDASATITPTTSTANTTTDEATTGAASITDSTSTSTTDDTDTNTDTEAASTGPVEPCAGEGQDVLDFSYIWVANAGQGTVSKINTETMQEQGRYLTRPEVGGSPSRTSVNLRGDVAVANRQGGVSKFFARAEDCPEANGIAGLQTSSGKEDVLAWELEECRAWHTPFLGSVMRPMAWTAGTLNLDTCVFEDMKVWTTRALAGQPGTVVAIRLNGDTGAIEAEIPVPELHVGTFGPYGGAVDADANFWFHSRDGAPYPLVRVDAVTLDYQIFNVPPPVNPYGITVDAKGRPWIAGYHGAIARFDPDTEAWVVLEGVTGLGIQEDSQGRMFIAQFPWNVTRGVHVIDSETVTVLDYIDMSAAAPQSRGISIDFAGFVWMIDDTANAFRIDPVTKTYEVYTGLTAPYTYSDMTGWGLSNVIPK